MGRAKDRVVKPGFLRGLAEGTDQDGKKNRQRNKSPRQHTSCSLADDNRQGSAICARQKNSGCEKEEGNRGQKRGRRVSAGRVKADQVVGIRDHRKNRDHRGDGTGYLGGTKSTSRFPVEGEEGRAEQNKNERNSEAVDLSE